MRKYVTGILLFMSFLLVNKAAGQDWPNLNRYRKSNEQLKSLAVPSDRVVFIGNSITDYWIDNSPGFFQDNHYVDRGISGQTSPQMLLRFRSDVIELKPKAVVIECGTNDIAGNTGPSTLQMIEGNIQSMTELARSNDIKVILGSVLPANRFAWAPNIRPAELITELNNWIKAYAVNHNIAYVDYYSSLVDDSHGMKWQYSDDGVHPNKEGYTVMEKLLQPVVRKSIGN